MIRREAIRIRRRKGLLQCRRWSYPARLLTPKAIGRAGTTPKPCSCKGCGGPRRHLKGLNKLSLQERRSLQINLTPEP